MIVPTVFISSDNNYLINWEIITTKGFQEELLPEFCSYEIIDAYYNVLSVFHLYFNKNISFGIRLEDNSYQMIKKNKFYLKGDSMGIAWLIGAISMYSRKKFPNNLLAWGAIKPIRNGGFSVYKTSGTEQKIYFAIQNKFDKIVFHKDEKHSISFQKSILLPSDIKDTFNILLRIVNE